MCFLKSKRLKLMDGIVHGFSDRVAGADASLVEKYSKLPRIAQLKQIHSADVIVLDDIENHDDLTEGDSIITSLKDVGIGIRTADCVPILLADKNKSVVAAVHAGWRGTLYEIAVNTVNTINSEYGISPSELTSVIGPSISSCCYEVGEDVATLFKERFSDCDQYLFESGESKYVLDLSTANKIALEKAGVLEIENVDTCTKCNENFYSYRREGKGVSTQLSFIALTD